MFNDCFNIVKSKKVAVAVSGGIDSLSLVLLANEWSVTFGTKIIGITVDHGLRQTSKDEAIYVGEILKKYNIEHHILTWEGEKPTTNVENLAREARYSLIFDFCKKNNIDTLLIGHHIQDQAENFLIRLFRGSSITGLSSMKLISERDGIKIIRPFLNIKKEELKQYLLDKKIKWIEDESNYDDKYLRNKIRIFLNTFNDRDLIVKRINSAISTFQMADEAINEKINELEGKVYNYNKEYKYYTINFKNFVKLERDIKIKILLKISKIIGENNENIRFIKLERLLNGLANLSKYTFNNCIFEKVNSDYFVCYKEYNSIKDKTNYLKKGYLNNYLKYLKDMDYQKYKKIKDFRGFKREILYTIPVEDDYIYFIKNTNNS